jgi:tetratricopeptide (TPR) repeat protein
LNLRVAIAKIANHLRTFPTAVLILLAGSAFAATEAPELQQLRDQLKKAQEAEDKPAIIELSQRIVAAAPNDSGTWDTLAQTQLESEELDDLERTLDAWQKTFKKPPTAIEDFRAGLCFKRKDYQCAEQHWLAFIATKPPRADVATAYDNLAELCAAQARWADHAAYRTKAIAAQDTAARRVLRAVAFLRVHNWDAAYADMAKANKMDATNPQVKDWLPEFERLQKFLPQIKTLDAQIAKSPSDAALLLERARVFILAGRPLLAINDAERAFKLQPASMRARIELAEALLDTGQSEDAAKLEVDRYLRRVEDKSATAGSSRGGHVSDEALRELGRLDARLSSNPKDADALVARAKVLRDLRQFTLALADADAALAINDKSAAAHFEAAQDLDGLNREKEALLQARIATELDPGDSKMWFFRGVLERQRADCAGAVASQTRSIEISESIGALSEREQCERRIGKTAEADADLHRIQALVPQKTRE